MNKKLWAGRFDKTTNSMVEQYTASIFFDAELILEDILGSLAHSQMLAHCKIISTEECKLLHQGLHLLVRKLTEKNISFSIADEDIHMNIERMLMDHVGDVAAKIHTARSRNDQIALDLHLYLRKKILIIFKLLLQMQQTLLKLTKEHLHTVCPGYTHLQRAQPILLAQYWLAYGAMLQRDCKRLQHLWQQVNLSPLGACALAGTSLPIDREYVAKILGFDGIYHNTLDAISNRDFIVDFLSISSLVMMHLSRMSEEIILWSSHEFNFITLDDSFCTGSSMMPQKKNPDVAELGRAKTGRVYGALISLLTLLKGLPLAYNKDLQEDKEPLFDTIKTLKQTLSVYIPMLNSLKINANNMSNATRQGYINATALAEYLVKQGIPFRFAHQITGQMVALAIEKNCPLEELSLAEMQKICANINETIYSVLSLENIITSNNPNISSVNQELALAGKSLYSSQQWLDEKDKLLMQVYNNFELPY